MLTLNDWRSELWQWDTGRTLAVDADCSQVHFSNKVFGRSIDVDVVDGVAIIPDVLLQTDKDLNVWAFVGTADNGFDGVELMDYGDDISTIIPEEKVIGVHMLCPYHWLDFWNGLSQTVVFSRINAELERQLLGWLDFWSRGNHDDRTLVAAF